VGVSKDFLVHGPWLLEKMAGDPSMWSSCLVDPEGGDTEAPMADAVSGLCCWDVEPASALRRREEAGIVVRWGTGRKSLAIGLG